MAIPDFQTVMLPLLHPPADGQEHTNRQVLDALADQFDLTEDEKRKLLPSGQDFVFRNPVAWARTHMKAAGLIANPKRGIFVITQAGRDLLASGPERVDLNSFVPGARGLQASALIRTYSDPRGRHMISFGQALFVPSRRTGSPP